MKTTPKNIKLNAKSNKEVIQIQITTKSGKKLILKEQQLELDFDDKHLNLHKD